MNNLKNEDKDKKDIFGYKSKKKAKKWKKLNTNFLFLAIRLIAVISVFEAFFLANYLDSSDFLSQVNKLSKELQLLISRQP